jgi:hypothetical protein
VEWKIESMNRGGKDFRFMIEEDESSKTLLCLHSNTQTMIAAFFLPL